MNDATLSRRTFIGAAVALGATSIRSGSARATTTSGRVAVLGGGMAGLTVAHELIERGFEVTVYERKALGGKARSIPTDLPTAGGRQPLPGEHGFRFFPGFYHNVPDTMRRIPFPGNRNGVWDNLVNAPSGFVSVAGENLVAPFGLTPELPSVLTPQNIVPTVLGGIRLGLQVPPLEVAEFGLHMMVFLTSCDERRYGQWEYVSWLDYIRAPGKSEAYRRFLSRALTRALVAAKEQVASARTIGNMADAFVATALLQGNDGAPDRVLDRPTNEAWIDPWVAHLDRLGVRFETGVTVESLQVNGGRIASAAARDSNGAIRRVDADWFVCAMPVERARRLWNREILELAPTLEQMNGLVTDWMNGIQYYLTTNTPITPGHQAFADSPWALSALNQAQFWPQRDLARDYGDGTVRDILSVDISDWNTPGILYGRPATDCTRDEIATEVWAQLKAGLYGDYQPLLRDETLHSWFLDPAIQWSAGTNTNDEPLLINTAGSWDLRPTARTDIPNLFLAGDYVRTNIDLASMEGANESGRTAANALLDAADSPADRARVFDLYRLPQFNPAKQIDRQRFASGLPHLLDTF
ncbi:hydroxysqualene dehydroxylase [Nocardia sp. CA-128927]|uniref:hydroxysqualene dehydroxylase n=1 Tax=Nocardia sp. CA-128927 TaxID=3239975 RepID=UPI003D9640AA